MYIVEIRLEGAKRPKYAGLNDSVEIGVKKAQLHDKDSAENCKRRLIATGFRAESIFIRNKDDLKKKTNLFGAIPAFWCEKSQRLVTEKPLGEHKWFGSTIEAEVYQFLRQHYRRVDIFCQYPLLVKPASKRYPAIDWRVDFKITWRDESGMLKYRYIEVKGIALPEFLRNIQYLEYFSPDDYSKLIIVGGETKQIDQNISQHSFAHFQHLVRKGEV